LFAHKLFVVMSIMCAAIADADVGADADADAETHGSRRLSFYVFVPACHVSMGKVRAIKK